MVGGSMVLQEVEVSQITNVLNSFVPYVVICKRSMGNKFFIIIVKYVNYYSGSGAQVLLMVDFKLH